MEAAAGRLQLGWGGGGVLGSRRDTGGSFCRTGRTPRRRADSTRPRRRRQTGHTGGATWRACVCGAGRQEATGGAWRVEGGACRAAGSTDVSRGGGRAVVQWVQGAVGVGCSGAMQRTQTNAGRVKERDALLFGGDGRQRRGRAPGAAARDLSARREHGPGPRRSLLVPPGRRASSRTSVPATPPSPPTHQPALRLRRAASAPPNPHTMAMRLAVSRPLAAAARSTAARAFSTTALRAKEIAGEKTETPNMRVCWHRRRPPPPQANGAAR